MCNAISILRLYQFFCQIFHILSYKSNYSTYKDAYSNIKVHGKETHADCSILIPEWVAT